MMQSQSSYIHQLTPYPSEDNMDSFPFPTYTKPSTAVGSSSKIAEYARPHASSHVAASFRLPTIYSPVPPSLMHRRTSSSSTNSTISSASSSSWGNSVVMSPPMLSRSGSVSSTFSSRRGSVQHSPVIKTPEVSTMDSFDDETVVVKGNKATRFSPATLIAPIFPTLGRPVSPARMAVPTKPSLKASSVASSSSSSVSSSASRPKLARRPTPIPSQPIVAPFSTLTSKPKPKAKSAPLPQRPKLIRKVTPHPEHNDAIDLQRSEVRAASKRLSLDSSFQAKMAKLSVAEEEESESESDEDMVEVEVAAEVRGRRLSRSPTRRFSSVINEGQIWLAV